MRLQKSRHETPLLRPGIPPHPKWQYFHLDAKRACHAESLSLWFDITNRISDGTERKTNSIVDGSDCRGGFGGFRLRGFAIPSVLQVSGGKGFFGHEPEWVLEQPYSHRPELAVERHTPRAKSRV